MTVLGLGCGCAVANWAFNPMTHPMTHPMLGPIRGCRYDNAMVYAGLMDDPRPMIARVRHPST